MEITRIPTLENLDLDTEWDAAYQDHTIEQKFLDEWGRIPLVLCGSSEPGALEGASYLYIDGEYDQDMSEGQRALYKVLLELQSGATYCVTSINKLMQTLEQKTPMSIMQRLENLQSIGAISGLKI